MLKSVQTVVFCSCFAAGVASAADWTQYRGPNHDGSTPENILTTWPKEGPAVVWKAPIGESFGSFAVGGGKAYIFIERGGNEVCVALDANTGKEVWAATIGKTIFEKQGGNGPRSTPTIDGNAVYVLGTFLRLVCLNAADGKEIWAKDLGKEAGGSVQLQTAGINNWGVASSPVLDGNLIYVHGGGKGGSLLGIDKKTGNIVWKSEDELLTHASAVPATIHDIRQVIFFCKSGLVSVAADTGKALWKHPFPWKIVYCSAGYGVGGGACKISKSANGLSAAELWRAQPGQLANHWTTPVCKDGYLYGIYGFKEYGTAPLQCVEIATGKVMWSKPGFGSGGGTILVGGTHVLVQGDKGPLVLVEASPKGYVETARAQPLGGDKFWSMAVVANGRIYARNTKEAICLDVSPK
jgi:outer membrane protein assembly factor BamB